MTWKRLAGSLLMIAAGLLACWMARGDASVPEWEVNHSTLECPPGFDFDPGATWAPSFGELSLPAGIDWDGVSHPLQHVEGSL